MNYSTNKIAIVIQGPSNYVKDIKNIWKDYENDLIFSTWIGSEKEYEIDDIVVFNKEPEYPGPFNFNYQKISTFNGLLKAKELGYSHVLKIRSDYFPTNPKSFMNLLDLNKMNFLMWHYTTFLWKDIPTLKGYFTDHLSFGPIDYMIDMWDIEQNFCHSPEIIITWNYIKKLKDKIDINFLINNLKPFENDLFYIKLNNQNYNNIFSFNSKLDNLWGRYESVFKDFKEYTKTPDEIKKYLNDNYLKFLSYFNYLPKITIIKNDNSDLNELIYPINKLIIKNDEHNIDTPYIIYSNDINNKYDLILEYFKKSDTLFCKINLDIPSNQNLNSKLITIDEFKKLKNIND